MALNFVGRAPCVQRLEYAFTAGPDPGARQPTVLINGVFVAFAAGSAEPPATVPSVRACDAAIVVAAQTFSFVVLENNLTH